MKCKILPVFILLFSFFAAKLLAQSSCPPNIDFEFGNLANWQFYNGTVKDGPIFTLTPSAPVLGREELTTGTGLDPYGLFPIVAPGGGGYSLKLGDSQNGTLAEKACYYIHVPAGVTNFSLIYRYAVVFEDPGADHMPEQKPTFLVNAFDSVTGKPIPCAQYTYVAGALPGFFVSTVKDYNGLFPYYKPWATGSINLSGLQGRTITLDVVAGDCTLGAHFGYGYIDLTCGLFAIESKICDATLATLTGPSGFSSYAWYDSLTFTHFYGNTQVITMPIPATPTTFAVIIQPYIGFGCPDTLYTRVFPSYLAIKASNDTLICSNSSIGIHVNATDNKDAYPLSYSWSPAIGLSCSTCDSPVVTPLTSTTYTVTVTDMAGCEKKDQVVVTTDKVTASTTKVDDSCFGFNNGSATVIPATGKAPYSYVWSTTPLQTSGTAHSLLAGTYTVTVTDSLGCIGEATARINQPPANNITINAYAGPTTCLGSDGYIVLTGLKPGTTYTFTYTFNTIAKSQTRTAGADGSDTLKFLSEGVYDNITVVVTSLPRPYCPYNIVGPLTLMDPPLPPLPSVGNNGPLCIGDTLKLNAKDAVPGVFFDWKGPGGFTWNQSDTAIANADFPQAGVYTVTVTKNACSSTNITKVIIKPYPVPSATGDTACSGTDIHLFASSANGADAYRWAGPDAYFSFVQNPLIYKANALATGVYTLTATLNGCAKTTTAKVTVVQTPAAPTLADTVYCQYQSPVPPLSVNGSSMTWYAADGKQYPGIPQPNTDVPGTTTWYADLRIYGPGADPVTCISDRAKATVKVIAKSIPVMSVSDTVICTGNEVSFAASNLGADNNGIHWTLTGDNDVHDVNPLRHAFDAVGTYTISVTPTHKYCPDPTLAKVVRVFPYPVINLGSDTSICAGSKSITIGDNINADDLRAKWLWNTNETTPNIVVTKPGIYYAKVQINGCPSSDTVTVLNNCYIDVPNAFTPNGDGTNDYFLPRQYLTNGLTDFKMEVYNRWGQVIFTSNNVNCLGWDGKFNNVPQPEGVYVFRIDVSFKDGQTEKHAGNFTLLR